MQAVFPDNAAGTDARQPHRAVADVPVRVARRRDASDWHMAHLGTYALANLGPAITEARAVEPKGRISPMCLGLYSDARQEGLARILRFYRDYGTTKFGIQLAHAGRKSSVLPSLMIRKAGAVRG